nr:MAG TPA: hypothetical protein [Caudoviricetes sp.]
MLSLTVFIIHYHVLFVNTLNTLLCISFIF